MLMTDLPRGFLHEREKGNPAASNVVLFLAREIREKLEASRKATARTKMWLQENTSSGIDNLVRPCTW